MKEKDIGYAFLFYDVRERKVSKVMKVCRKYLEHTQNSVFKGIIDKTNYLLLKEEIENIIDIEEDYVFIALLKNEKDFKKIELGESKRIISEDNDFI